MIGARACSIIPAPRYSEFVPCLPLARKDTALAKRTPKTPLAKAYSRCAVEELAATNAEDALKEIVDAMVAKRILKTDKQAEVLKGLLEREKLGTTAIGKGVALPHVRRASLKEPIGAIGHSTEGLDFRALDGGLTHTICVTMTPVNPPEIHLDFMTRMLTLTSEVMFTKLLNQTKKLGDFVELFEEREVEAG